MPTANLLPKKKLSSFPFLRHTVYSVGGTFKLLSARENRGRLYAYSKPLKYVNFLWHTVYYVRAHRSRDSYSRPFILFQGGALVRFQPRV
jgi:hypothetical protein